MIFEHLGFTGTRHRCTNRQHDALSTILCWMHAGGSQWLHVGDCVGSDYQAAMIWRQLGGKLHGHPPDVDTLRAFLDYDRLELPKPYIPRNRDIVDVSAAMIATPAEMIEQTRGGTWSTIRYARKLARPLCLIYPDGSMDRERWP
jgi:hypothetical protein